MRSARILNHGQVAGLLEELLDGTFRFSYDPMYLASDKPPISLTLPKSEGPFVAPTLFPYFFGLLSEGSARELQVQTLNIDEDDTFGLLVATGEDTVGSVSIERLT
ncbi:MAG: phosphatidylinositol kinase [Proteobacteria bacterium]|nr:phosphatidylinositol kinase [Pseudomonadota bacterium]